MKQNKIEEKGKIGFWLSTSLVVGNMAGSGIFLLPAALALYGGISVFGWLFTVLGSIFLALVFSRLSSLITRAGGPYSFSREGFGDFAGFLVAWGYWLSIWTGNAAISVAGVGYLSIFIPSLKENPLLSALVAVGAIWFFTYINTKSIKKVGLVQLVTTLLKILPLLALGTFGYLYFNKAHFTPFNLSELSNFDAVTATAALALWAFLGLESATIPSDKVKNPSKTIPRSTVAGILLAALLYVSSTVGVMGIISPAELQESAAPFADAAQKIWGNCASGLVAAGAAIACFGALNGWILLQGQLPMAAARDKLFPSVFKKVSKKGSAAYGPSYCQYTFLLPGRLQLYKGAGKHVLLYYHAFHPQLPASLPLLLPVRNYALFKEKEELQQKQIDFCLPDFHTSLSLFLMGHHRPE